MKRFSKKTGRTTEQVEATDAPASDQASAQASSDQSGQQQTAEQAAGGEAAPEKRVLLLVIASDPAILDDLITTMLDLGVSGATVLESKGMGAILREEMPIFAGLASMLPQNTGSRVLLSIATPDLAKRFFGVLRDELKKGERPIAFTVPIDASVGLKR